MDCVSEFISKVAIAFHNHFIFINFRIFDNGAHHHKFTFRLF